ncbi:hypothetical protein [Turicibacter sp. TJ11]|uniref:hypothetical protein n=1 Tax=Turicibacter sp. TJ11 TaxID=2806443 RepID=UPI001F3FB497|nr:hypothetical protein [Turicibacter sp. TJ11]
MEKNNSYNPFRLLSDAHLTEDMSCCTDTYLLDRSTMKVEPCEVIADVQENTEEEK